MISNWKVTLGTTLALAWPFASSAGEEAIRLVQIYGGRVAHIETIGVLYDTSLKNDIGSGSGFLIGPRHVLTVNHNIPQETNYKSLTVSIRLGSRLHDPLTVEEYVRDPERDLALITLKQEAAAGRMPCPVPVIKDASLTPLGTDLLAMGYPLNRDFAITSGMLGSYSADNGRWLTDTLITFGYSGGPMFTDNGTLVGLSVAGTGSWEIGGEVRRVAGVNFLIPATLLRQSPLMAAIEQIPQHERCWRSVPDGQPIMFGQEWLGAQLPEMLQRSLTVSVTKDDHPVVFGRHSRSYERRITADPGYVITHCTWTATTASEVSKERCVIDEKGESAVFTFELTSGPAVDRYRGWWGGQVQVEQRRKM